MAVHARDEIEVTGPYINCWQRDSGSLCNRLSQLGAGSYQNKTSRVVVGTDLEAEMSDRAGRAPEQKLVVRIRELDISVGQHLSSVEAGRSPMQEDWRSWQEC